MSAATETGTKSIYERREEHNFRVEIPFEEKKREKELVSGPGRRRSAQPCHYNGYIIAASERRQQSNRASTARCHEKIYNSSFSMFMQLIHSLSISCGRSASFTAVETILVSVFGWCVSVCVYCSIVNYYNLVQYMK